MYPKNLWPHQVKAIGAALHALTTRTRKGLWVMPPGTGKTRALCELIRMHGGRTLVVARTNEMLRQVRQTLGKVYPGVSVEQLRSAPGAWLQATVCLASSAMLTTINGLLPPGHFDLVVIDEAHLIGPSIRSKIIGYFYPDLFLGCSASRRRIGGEDVGEDLGELIGEPLYSYGIGQAVSDRRLVPILLRHAETGVSLEGIEDEEFVGYSTVLTQAVNTVARNQMILAEYRSHAVGRPTLLFAASPQHLQDLAAVFSNAGVRVASATKETNLADRAGLYDGLACGRYQVILTCGYLVDDCDRPEISCIILARPYRGLDRYGLWVSRGLRPCPKAGKEDCLVIEIRDQFPGPHPLASVTALFKHAGKE
jgi:ATP-dependent helicase IRC3